MLFSSLKVQSAPSYAVIGPQGYIITQELHYLHCGDGVVVAAFDTGFVIAAPRDVMDPSYCPDIGVSMIKLLNL